MDGLLGVWCTITVTSINLIGECATSSQIHMSDKHPTKNKVNPLISLEEQKHYMTQTR